MADADQNTPQLVPQMGTGTVAVRQLVLLIGLAAAIAAGVALVLWSQGRNYSTLFSGLAERDTAGIVTALEGTGVPYRLDPTTGGVMVPANLKYQVRMDLAAAGLPRGSSFGIEELPERSGFGQSAFMENALYLHAMETELARTIASLQPVDTARVHLAVPAQSAFVRRRQNPTASVTVGLFPGRRLEPGQVQAIVHTVASSIPDLSPARVTVVDQSSALLTQNADDENGPLTNSQFEYAREVERDFADRITDLLGAIVGPSRVRASVSAELDFTVSEQTRESFDPDSVVVRSESSDEQTQSGDSLAQGIPGALSNQPPENADATVLAVDATAEPSTSTTRSQSRNFEIDKTISHTKQAVGQIQRLSVAVLVDNKPPASGRGEGEPLAQEELDSLTELVKQAVGFNEVRGDTISMLNSAFQVQPALRAPEPPSLWERPMIWDIARQVLGAILVIVLAMVVLRPIIRNLLRPQMNFLAAAGNNAGNALPHDMQQQSPPSWALPHSYDDRMAAARGVAGQDPRQVAQVVRNWVAEDNG